MTNLEQKAKEFATKAHTGQVRKYSFEAYVNHPAAVVELVRSVPHTEAMLCAAWLHDVVEDTTVTIEEIESEFGSEIAVLVECLTDVSRASDGNRSVRKAIDREHTSRASAAAKTVKLADLIDNTESIFKHDPKFAKVFGAEKRLLLEVLTEGDATLFEKAKTIL